MGSNGLDTFAREGIYIYFVVGQLDLALRMNRKDAVLALKPGHSPDSMAEKTPRPPKHCYSSF